MVSDIKSQFVKKLKEAKWMSKDVRELGIEKGISGQSYFGLSCTGSLPNII